MQRATPTPPPPDEDTSDCPLCMEEIDPTDRHFKPCPCGYQVCRFCWNRIRQNENERCPACRREYTDEAVEFTPLSAEELATLSVKSKKKANKTSESSVGQSPLSTTRKEFMDDEDGPVLPSRRHLVEVRVTQKNLVYVIGIPIHLADEATLKLEEYFGRFGKILKLVINKRAYVRTTGNGAINNAAAYITFSRDDEALKVIKQVDGKMIDGAKLLRATYGTTKYCAHFLRGKQCPKTGCLYLHHEVFDNEISTGDVSNVTSPPASPSPMATLTVPHSVLSSQLHQQHPQQTPQGNEMESERVKSFFERLHKWTKMDDLLADLSPEADFLKSDTCEAPSFNPFDDPIVDAVQPIPRRRSIHDVFANASQHQPSQELSKPTVEVPSKKTPPKTFTTAQLASKKMEKSVLQEPKQPEKPIAVPVPVPTAPVVSLPQTPKAPIPQPPSSPAPPASTTANNNALMTAKSSSSKPSTPIVIPKKSAPVTTDNLFSVLSVEDMAASVDDGVEKSPIKEPEADKDSKPAPTTYKSNKKAPKKDPKKQLEEDLDELWKQIEATKPTACEPAKPQTQQPHPPKSKQPTEKKQAKPTPPLANLFAALSKANEWRDNVSSPNHNDLLNLEGESARRIIELEKALKESRMDSREIEERLRESVTAFLQSMNISLDDDYFKQY